MSDVARLYANDANGIHDEDWVDEVGCALYARCESIAQVSRIVSEHVLVCPWCQADIAIQDMAFACGCGFAATWKEVQQTYQGKQLFGTNAMPVFAAYLRDYPTCRDYRDKMQCIDALINAFHQTAQRDGYTLGRPVGCNLIEGKMRDVIAFLDNLSASQNNTAWRDTIRKADYIGHFTHNLTDD